MENKKCVTCGTNVGSRENFVTFKCPQCGQFEVVRCSHCKNLSNKYECESCQFVGP